MTTDVPAVPDGDRLPPDTCVRVDVYRNQARGNPLPTFFGNLVGVANQGVRATATAQVAPATRRECLKPWVIIDRWDEIPGRRAGLRRRLIDFGPTSTYDKYIDGNGQTPTPEDDLYVPPSADSTGHRASRYPSDDGRQFAIKAGTQRHGSLVGLVPVDAISRASIGQTWRATPTRRTSRAATDAGQHWRAPEDTVSDQLRRKSTATDKIYWAARGCVRVQTGITQGPTLDGVEIIIAMDPSAALAHVADHGSGGSDVQYAEPAHRAGRRHGHRQYLARIRPDPDGVVRIVNIFGFFIEGMGDIDKATGAIT